MTDFSALIDLHHFRCIIKEKRSFHKRNRLEAATTDKELRKLKKLELIEMLYYLRKETDELKAENDQLRAKLLLLSSEAT